MLREGGKRRDDAFQLGGGCNKDPGKGRERRREGEVGRGVEGRRACCFFFGHQQQLLLPTSLNSQRSTEFHELSARASTAPRRSLEAVCSCSR